MWKTRFRFICDDFTRIGCKNANKYMLAGFRCVGLTAAGLAWNELVCLNVNGIRVKSLE